MKVFMKKGDYQSLIPVLIITFLFLYNILKFILYI